MAQESFDQPGDPSRQGNVGASKEQSGEPTLTCVEINGKSEDHKEWCGFPSPDENRYSEQAYCGVEDDRVSKHQIQCQKEDTKEKYVSIGPQTPRGLWVPVRCPFESWPQENSEGRA